jgi:aspartate/methionine/tyrosine aminotransferase
VSGSPYLREAIANLYSTITPEEIVVHVGAQEPIFNFMNVLLEKEEHVICQFPIYQSLFEVANSIGSEVTKSSLEQSDNGWVIDIDKLESMIKPSTKLICLNSPNNPTGYTLKKEEIEKIVEIARRYDLYV